MLNHTKRYAEKIHSIDAELAGHVHKLHLKVPSSCASGFSLFAARMLAKPCHFEVNLPTTLSKTRMGTSFYSQF